MSGMTVDQELAGFMYSLEKSGGYLGGGMRWGVVGKMESCVGSAAWF